VLTARGEWEEAERELARATGELATLRPPLAGFARARFAQLRRRQGRYAEARRLLAEAGGHVLVPLVQAEVALDEGDPSAALGYAERYVRSLAGDQPIESAAALELLVPIRLRLAEPEAAREAHARLAMIADTVATDQVRAAERVACAAIALADNDPGQACRALDDAIDLYRRSAAPFDVARTQLALAQALAAHDRPVAALEHAHEASAALERLGATRAAKEAARLVGRLGGRTVAAKRAGLTGRELEVLILVAGGLSNPQVAERLVISEHTVHRHLANVFAKLGVSSRTAAVAVAAERELLA